MSDYDDKVHQFPTHRRATEFEHMTNDEFMIAVFGREAFEFCRAASPEQLEGTWLIVVDPARKDDVMREFERRGARLIWGHRH